MGQALIARPYASPPLPFAPDSAYTAPGQTETQNTATLAVTSTSGNVAINLNGAAQVELYNAGSFDCFVVFGVDNTVAATVPSTSTGSYPLGAGQCKVISFAPSVAAVVKFIAAICAGTNTTTLYASPGVGAS